jgi:hypothetical protein
MRTRAWRPCRRSPSPSGGCGRSSFVDPSVHRLQNEIVSGEWADTAGVLEAFYDAILAAPKPHSTGTHSCHPVMSLAGWRRHTRTAPNQIFESEQVDHRMRNGSVIDIFGATESEVIDDAMRPSGPFTTAQTHLSAGLRTLSDRKSPNTPAAIRAPNCAEAARGSATSFTSRAPASAVRTEERVLTIGSTKRQPTIRISVE